MSSSYNFLTIPVVDILSYFGKRVDHRSYMYYSPFRDESEPSMRVTVKSDGTWVWSDFGGSPQAGKYVDGGGVLDLVMRLGKVTTRKAAMDILEKIAAGRGVSLPAPGADGTSVSVKDSGIVIDDATIGFSRKSLCNYAVNVRRIPLEILEKYCRQVTFHYKADASRTYTYIGFPNNAGGFALRGSAQGKKLNNIWGLSTLDPEGNPVKFTTYRSDKCVLFEGFMDFLSYLSWRKVCEPEVDVCVLHSASNTAHAQKWVLGHKSVRTYFDNDGAGNRATDLVRGWCQEAGLEFMDCRSMYQGFNDVNEKWVSLCKAREETLEDNNPGLDAGMKIK